MRLDPGTTKNGEGRSFPFTGDIEKILKDQFVIHDTLKKKADKVVPFVFHRDGERIRQFRTSWKNVCKAAGCPGKLIHDMRRSAVRTYERAGVPRSVAMSIVGHKTESIYRRYAIVDEATQREAVGSSRCVGEVTAAASRWCGRTHAEAATAIGQSDGFDRRR